MKGSTTVAAGSTAAAVPPADLYARGLRGAELVVRHEDGATRPVPLTDWLGPLTPEDERLLDRLTGPVLDVGCGPGRHIAGLAARGIAALGLDISPAAVQTARRRGARVLEASVFDRVPGAGRWRTVLLLDGNIGIGGCPRSLLARAAALAAPGGHVVAELEPPGGPSGPVRVRLEDGDASSAWFTWAHVSADDVDALAARAGLRVDEVFREGSRWFAVLSPR